MRIYSHSTQFIDWKRGLTESRRVSVRLTILHGDVFRDYATVGNNKRELVNEGLSSKSIRKRTIPTDAVETLWQTGRGALSCWQEQSADDSARFELRDIPIVGRSGHQGRAH